MGCAKPTVSTLGLGDTRSMGVHGLAGSAVTLSLFLSPALGELRSRPPPPWLSLQGWGVGVSRPQGWVRLGSHTREKQAGRSVGMLPGCEPSRAVCQPGCLWVVWLPSPPPPWPETQDRGPVPRLPVRSAPREGWQEEAALPAPRPHLRCELRGTKVCGGCCPPRPLPQPCADPPETGRAVLPRPGPHASLQGCCGPWSWLSHSPGPPKGHQHRISRRAANPFQVVDGADGKEDRTRTETCAHVSTAAVVTVTKRQKPPSVRDRTDWSTNGSIYTGEYYTARKRSEVLTYGATWTDLGHAMLGGRRGRTDHTL